MALRWNPRKCGCVKANLPQSGKVMVRCARHRGKPSKKGRMLAYFGESTIVTKEAP